MAAAVQAIVLGDTAAVGEAADAADDKGGFSVHVCLLPTRLSPPLPKLPKGGSDSFGSAPLRRIFSDGVQMAAGRQPVAIRCSASQMVASEIYALKPPTAKTAKRGF
jgi:hypothetical protein